jgi:hypothetical protein
VTNSIILTLNYKNSLTINFDTIKDMVINNRDDVKTVRDDYKITRDHKRLLTVHQDKDYMRLLADPDYYPNIREIFHILLTMPCERPFSALRRM